MSYNKLTVSQVKYLIAIYNINTSNVSLSEVATSLEVSKSSAHKMLATMEKIGLVEKEAYGDISLTKKGISCAEEIRRDYLRIMRFFVDSLEMSPNIANKDAVNFISSMSEDLVEKFIENINSKNEEINIDRDISTSTINVKDIAIGEGCYEVPFKLLKYDEKTVSMGNKALIHPCIMDISDEKAIIMIRPKKITHKSLSGMYLSGRLSRLCYWNGQRYLDAKVGDDLFLIPIYDINPQNDELGVIINGKLRLKVYASVGIFNMPASEAKLRLNFASRKKIVKLGRKDVNEKINTIDRFNFVI